MESRKDDRKKAMHFRSERFCMVNEQWFFLTRDACMGPFATRDAAESGLCTYLDEMVCLRRFQESRGKARVVRLSNDRVRPLTKMKGAGEQSVSLQGLERSRPKAYSACGSSYPQLGHHSAQTIDGSQLQSQAGSIKATDYPAMHLEKIQAQAGRGRI
ncbi:MAG: hypothetical protein KUG75_09195 [Pseudomonadales bacterium]|nr:hypothetical protein [Pseudomonadales bacterium]